MNNRSQHKVGAAAAYAFAALMGFVVAFIIVLNLHIMVGLEQGYAASPSEVVNRSAVLAVVDVALLVAGSALGVVAWSRMRGHGRRKAR